MNSLQQNFISMLVLAAIMIASTNALSCLPCNKTRCVEPENCRGGIALDVCGCCDVCAKVEGERCGGPWGITGTCDKGLDCIKKDENDFNADGICRGEPKELEKCPPPPYWLFSWKSWQYCHHADTVFCSRDCKKCCIHHNDCNPSPYRYITGSRCNM